MTGKTMHQVAVEWVEAHRANCNDDLCGCSKGDPEKMVQALCARWLGMEDEEDQ